MMNIFMNKKTNRAVSFVIILALVFGCIFSVSPLRPQEVYAREVSADEFKFFKMEGFPAKYPISENIFGEGNMNRAHAPYVPENGYGLISFSLEYHQKASIKVYEYAEPPIVDWTRVENENGKLKVISNPVQVSASNLSGAAIGYIKAYVVTDDYAWAELPLERPDLRDKLYDVKAGLEKDSNEEGSLETVIIKDFDKFHGYVDSGLPPGLQPASMMLTPAAISFVHNILLWDGSVVTENDEPVEVLWDKEKTYILMLDTEALAPPNQDYNSYLAFKADPDADPSELSDIEFDELMMIYCGDPVNMVNGSLTYVRTELTDEGSDKLSFTTTYDSRQAKTDYGLGYGWRHNHMYHVYSGQVTSLVLLPDGKKAYFELALDGTWEAREGSNFSFERLGSPVATGYVMTKNDGTVYSFDGDGAIQDITFKNGNQIIYTYDSAGRIETIENKSGSLEFSYGGGRIEEVSDSSGRSVVYAYNQAGQLESSENPDGDSLNYSYDANNHLETVEDFLGTIYMENEYDEMGRVERQYVEDLGQYHNDEDWSYFTYDTKNRVTTLDAPNGVWKKVYYDETGRVTAEEDSDGMAYYKYNRANKLESSTDRLGYTTEYEHFDNGKGNLKKITQPDGSTEEYEYYEDRLISVVTRADQNTLEYYYDSRGNIEKTIDARGGEREYYYDSDNNLEWSKDALGHITNYEYDHKGNLRFREDPLGNVTEYEYDGVGRLSAVITPLGNRTEYIYSDAGKLVEVVNIMGRGKTISTTYDVNGNGFMKSAKDAMFFETLYGYNAVSQLKTVEDPEGNITSYDYNENGFQVSVTDAEGYTAYFDYDNQGRILSSKDQRNHTAEFEYDAVGSLRFVTDPLGYKSEKQYDEMGRVKKEINARGAVTEYEYDVMGRVKKVIDAGGIDGVRGITEYDYDPNGNLIWVKDPMGKITEHEYDAENRKEKTIDAKGFEWIYEYDPLGRLVKTISPLGAENVTDYDEDGRADKTTDPLGYETEYFYDDLNRMERQENSDGTSVEFKYYDNGWLESSTNEEGSTMYYTYYDNGWLKSVTDYMGYTTSNTYTKLGQIKTVTDAEGGVTTYGYDPAGNMKSIKDPMNHTTNYAYDANNRVSTVTDARGGKTITTYDGAGNVKTVKNADNGLTEYFYDPLNRLIKRIDPEGGVFETKYDKNGNITKEIDGRGNFREFVYDNLNRAVEVRNEAGWWGFREYDADGRLWKVINEENAITEYTYDLKGQVKKIKDALGHFTHFDYDTMGRVETMTNARGAVTSYTYTPTGQVETITKEISKSPLSVAVTEYGYNDNGWLTSETNPKGETTHYVHDKLGRVTKKTDPKGNFEEFEYDANSRIKEVKDKNGNVTEYFFDANGNIIQTKDALGNSAYFDYDPMNRLKEVKLNRKDPRDNTNEWQVTLYQYNKNGLLTKQINAAGGNKVNVYDANGNLKQTTDEDGYITLYGYDPRNLIETINYNNGSGKETVFGYNKAGELIEMADWNGVTSFTLDLLGQITGVNDHGQNVSAYQYDPVGNQTKITYPDSSVANYEFDLLDRMVKLTDHENQQTTYTYDSVRLTGMAYPNGWDEAYQYDANGQLTQKYARDPSNMVNKSITHVYGYDPNGNILNESRTGAHGMDKYDLTHTYDALNRLTLTTGLWGYKDHEYVYDSLGNLTRERIHNKWTDYRYDNLNRQIEKLKDGKDKYINTFDNRGNFIKGVYEKNKNHSYIIEEYTYDPSNRMVRGINEDGEQSHYIYNGFGDLVANEWIIAKNAYGYTGVNAPPSGQVGNVVVCDRHKHTTGQGHINPTGNGHTTGGTNGAVTPSINSKQAVVHKDYALDYTDPLRRVLMESEGGAGGLVYRYVYGLDKVEVVVGSITNSAGSVTQYVYDDGTGNMVFSVKYPEQTVVLNSIVKLYYHQDRLGTSGYITDNVAGKVTSYVSYDDWGALTSKAVLRMGVRELDLVQNYTGHPYDMVLGIYYARARIYDAEGRRFMAVDPVMGDIRNPQSLVQYTYCLNNPIKYVDPTGLWSEYWHVNLTEKAMNELKGTLRDSTGRIISSGIVDFHKHEIAKGNEATDRAPKWAINPESQGRHLNRNRVGDSRKDWSEKLLRQAIDAWKYADNIYDYFINFVCMENNDPAIRAMHIQRVQALWLLGEGLHSIQDIDAHLNVGSDARVYVTEYHSVQGEYSGLKGTIQAAKGWQSVFDNPFYDIAETLIPVAKTFNRSSDTYTFTEYKYEYVAYRVPAGEFSKRYTDSLDKSKEYLQRFYRAVVTVQKGKVEFSSTR